MENSESTITRVGRAMWTVWGYLTGAVGRYLRPEVTTEENQNVNCKQEDNKEEEGNDEIGGKVRVRDAAVKWEKGNVGADHGNDGEKVINKHGFARGSCDSRVQERSKNVFLKAGDDASTPREDPLACTDTELSKTEKDHHDEKGSKSSQTKSSKPENEIENVGNLFKELNVSSPREDPLACTETDVKNKDDLSKTEEDHQDEKESKNSQEIRSEPVNEKEDVENLSKELSASSPREDPLASTNTDIINKDDHSKTEEDHQDGKGSQDSQEICSKPENEMEDIGNFFKELNVFSPIEDPLACTHTDIINKDDHSKIAEDHQDGKGSQNSQEICSKREDEKKDVGNFFKELNVSFPREDPLACTDTDVINKDDLTKTEEDHQDGKESKNSQEIRSEPVNEKKDVENLSKELNASFPREDPLASTNMDIINKDDHSKTEEDHQDGKGSQNSQEICSKPENEMEDIGNFFKELNVFSPIEDPLACTHTDIINKDDHSKIAEDHQDGKGSQDSQEICSKREDEKKDVGNFFKELNISFPREDPLACTHTDIINKDVLPKTEEDHQDGKGSQDSQEICSKPEDGKEDVENLFKELEGQEIKEGIGETAVIQKVLVEKTKENQEKTEEKNEAIGSQIVEGSCLPSQLVISTNEVEDIPSKSLKMEVSDQKVDNICKNPETSQMEHLQHQKTMEILENNDAKDSNLQTVDLSQSDPPIDTSSDISGSQRPKSETPVTEQDLAEALAKLKAGTGNQNDTLENKSEFETKANTEDVMKSSSRKQHLVSEMNQGSTEQVSTKDTLQTDDGQINDCSLQALLSSERDLTTLDLQSVGEMASSSLQELDRTDKIVEIMIDSTEEIDDTHTNVMHMCKQDMTTLKNEQMINVTGDTKADGQLNRGEFPLQDTPVSEPSLTQSDTAKETKEHKIIGETKLRFTDEQNAITDLFGDHTKNSELETTSHDQPMVKKEVTTQEIDQSFPEQGSADDSSISQRQDETTVDFMDEIPTSLAQKLEYITSETNETSVGKQDKSGHESGTSRSIVETAELVQSEPLVFDDISKTLSEDGEIVGGIRLQITASDDLTFSETESALEVQEMQMDTDTNKDINEDRTDSNETGSLAEGVVEKVMKTSEEDSKSAVVPPEELDHSYPEKELPDQTTTSVSEMVVHPEPEDEISHSTLHKQDETQWINEATLNSVTKLTPETKISSTEQTVTTKHVRNDQTCQQEQSEKDSITEAKDQTKTLDSKDTSETTPEDELNCSELAVTGLQIKALQPLSLPESESAEIWKDTHQDIKTTEIELKTTLLEDVEESRDMEKRAVPEVTSQSYSKEDTLSEQLPDKEVFKSLMQAPFTKEKPVHPEPKDDSLSSLMQELDNTEHPDETSVGSTSMSTHEQAKSESESKTESELSLEAVETTFEVLTEVLEAKAMIPEDTSDTLVEDRPNCVEYTIQDRSAVETELHRPLTDMQVDTENLQTTLLEVVEEQKDTEEIAVPEVICQSYTEKDPMQEQFADKEVTQSLTKASFTKAKPVPSELKDDSPTSLLQELDKTEHPDETSVGSTSMSMHELAKSESESKTESELSLEAVETTFEVLTEVLEAKAMIPEDTSDTLVEDRPNCVEYTIQDRSAVETELHRPLTDMQVDTENLKTTSLEVVEEQKDMEEIAVPEVICQSYTEEDPMQEQFADKEVTKLLMQAQFTQAKPVHPEPKDDSPTSLMQELDKTECPDETSVGSTSINKHEQAESESETKTESQLSLEAVETTFEVLTEVLEAKSMIPEDTSDTPVKDRPNCVEYTIQDRSAVETELHRPLTDMQVDTENLQTTSLEVVEEQKDTEEIAVPEVICQSYTEEDPMQEQFADKDVTKSLMQAQFTKAKPVHPELKDDSPTSLMQELDKTERPDETSVGSTSINKHEQAESESETKTEGQLSLEAVETPSEVLTEVVQSTSNTPLEDRTIHDRSAVETESHRPPKDMQMNTEMDTESEISGLIEGSDEDMKKAELETVAEEEVAQQEMSELCYSEEKSADVNVNELKCHLAEYRYHESSHISVENTLESVIPLEDQLNLGECTALDKIQTEFLGCLNLPESESALDALKILRDVKIEPEKRESTDGMRGKTNSAAASMGVVDELNAALKKKSKPNEKQILLSKTEGLEAKEMKAEVEVSKRDDEKDEHLTTYEEPKGETTVDGDKHLKERSRPGLKRGINQMESSSRVFQLQQVSFLDLTAQKSKIAVRRPDIRPPKDPRTLINMPSVEPSTLPLPSRPSPLEKPFKEDASTPRKNIIGFKLPGLGAGFPVLRKTEAGKRIKGEEDTHVPPQKSNAESQSTDEHVKPKPVPDKPDKPKWTPPKHPGMGSPMMMAELKNKLKKNEKE